MTCWKPPTPTPLSSQIPKAGSDNIKERRNPSQLGTDYGAAIYHHKGGTFIENYQAVRSTREIAKSIAYYLEMSDPVNYPPSDRAKTVRAVNDILQGRSDRTVDSLLAETLEDEENDEILLLDNGTVDLDEVFTTALVLAMDSKHVCSEDCKGLCATCGADLNEGPCGCKPEIDPRFAALAQLLDKESE